MAQDDDARTPGRSGDDAEWDAIFASQPGTAEPAAEPVAPAATNDPPRRARRNRGRPRRRGLAWLVAILVVLGLGAGSVAFVWLNFEEQVRKVMGWEIPPEDYVGGGEGEATITIAAGDTGAEVTRALLDADVIKSYEAFWELLLKENPSFYPGYYTLAQKMSARAALDALTDPVNRVENTALIREGLSADQAYEQLSAATGITIEEFEAVAEDHLAFGLPPEATNIEGYLFPARYTFDPGVDATTVISTLVNRTFQSLDAAGVAPEDRHRVLTIASLIQREAGSKEEDFYRVSRVIQNRLADGMLLQFDSTAHYGYAWAHGERQEGGVFSTKEELEDQNPYNTYVHTGLPPGPISAAGDLAINAAGSPADGPWRYFVTVNLETGETEFNETLDGHNASVAKMQRWCAETKSPNC